tara:strand:- start:3252 stop:3956 length:705 start_codon:yes stop_codon:yes gene_type:complete
MEITLTNSNSLKIISGNCTLITNPSSSEEYNIGLFNDPSTNINNNKLNVYSPGEFEIDNFYITSVGYKTSKSKNNIVVSDDNKDDSPLQPSLMSFQDENNNQKTAEDQDNTNTSGEYSIYYIIQVEGIKILALGDKVIPGNQKNKLSSENPKIILTPHTNISTVENNNFNKLVNDIDYRVLIISDIQDSYDEDQLYENSRIAFGIKDKSNLNKLNVTLNNLPKEKRIVLLNQSK